MKKVILITAIALTLFGCTAEKESCNCEGQFVNIETAEYIHQPTDCDRLPPEGYVFVKCLNGPDY